MSESESRFGSGRQRCLEGKVAIVTGAGQSIGRAEAMSLAAQGASVVVNDLGTALDGTGSDRSLAQKVVDEITALAGRAVASTDSVAEFSSAERIVQTALDVYGRVDILVNNAGILRPGLITDMSHNDFEQIIAVHLGGTFNLVRHAAPHMIKQKSGAIVNTSSIAGQGQYANSAYAAAKEGVIGFTRSIARDLGPHGVRVMAIRPLSMSRMNSPEFVALTQEAELRHGFASVADVWLTESLDADGGNLVPEAVGEFVAWFCTPSASCVNGATFSVAGGSISLMCEPAAAHSISQARSWTVAELQDPKVLQQLLGESRNRFSGKVD